MINKFTNYIIRPKRNSYDPQVDLGPYTFLLDEKYCGRIDFEVKNQRNQKLKCSLFHRIIDWNKEYPLIIYCHGNSGNRTDSYGPVSQLLKQNIFVVTFDFSGCGLSEGDYLSLGFYEQYDIDAVVDYLLEKYDFIDQRKIGIWGRSMGAVSTLLYSTRRTGISLIILDSPFSSFQTLLHDYINKYKVVQKLAGKYIYKNLRQRIHQLAKFDIEDLNPIKEIKKNKVPAFFLHGTEDKIIAPYHSEELYEAYPAEKELILFESGHNDARSTDVYEAILQFIKKKMALIKYDNFKPKKPVHTMGPKKILGGPMPVFQNHNSFSDTDEAKQYQKGNHKRDAFVQPDKPNSFDSTVMADSMTVRDEFSYVPKRAQKRQQSILQPAIGDPQSKTLDFTYGDAGDVLLPDLPTKRDRISEVAEDDETVDAHENEHEKTVILANTHIFTSKCDIEEIENLYEILQNIREQADIQMKSQGGSSTKDPYLTKEEYYEEENISHDESLDATNIPNQHSMSTGIKHAAESNFKQFRSKKSGLGVHSVREKA